MPKKNILFIEPWLPYPLTSGGHQAIFNGIAAVKDDFNIFLAYEPKGEDEAVLKAFLEEMPSVVLCPFPAQQSLLASKVTFRGCLKHFLGRAYHIFFPAQQVLMPTDDYGKQMVTHFNPIDARYYDYIADIVQKYHIDIVQSEMIRRISLVYALPQSVKKVFVHHELRYVCHELEMKGRAISAYEQACYEMARLAEIGGLNEYDAIITLSEVDKAKLIEAGVSKPIYSSFAIVNTPPNRNLHSEQSHMLTYLGGELHKPNYDGIVWFLENCWNKLLEADSRYKLKVIGKWSTETQVRLEQKYRNLEFCGFVPDINEAISDTISIIPLTVGSGIRMKILEASILGVPFVTTSVGVEGLPFESGRDCFIADTPDAFNESIFALQDKELRMRFIKNAQETVTKHYSLESLRKNRMEVYNKL